MICTKCMIDKPIEMFSWKVMNKRRYTRCKACHHEYLKIYYANNRVDYIRRAKYHRDFHKKRMREYIYKYLLQHPCHCGESDPVFLDFHHRDPKNKKFCISAAMHYKNGYKTIVAEICDVLCVRCHRLETAKQFNWWLLKMRDYGSGSKSQTCVKCL